VEGWTRSDNDAESCLPRLVTGDKVGGAKRFMRTLFKEDL
jgi:hypothetical protein